MRPSSSYPCCPALRCQAACPRARRRAAGRCPSCAPSTAPCDRPQRRAPPSCPLAHPPRPRAPTSARCPHHQSLRWRETCLLIGLPRSPTLAGCCAGRTTLRAPASSPGRWQARCCTERVLMLLGPCQVPMDETEETAQSRRAPAGEFRSARVTFRASVRCSNGSLEHVQLRARSATTPTLSIPTALCT